jgi:hypothetical protein
VRVRAGEPRATTIETGRSILLGKAPSNELGSAHCAEERVDFPVEKRENLDDQ